MARLLRRALLAPLIAMSACGAPQPVVGDPAAICTADQLAECEAALLEASDEELPRWVAAYAAARGEPAFRRLFEEMARAPTEPLLVGELPGAPASLRRAPLPPAPVGVPRDVLLLALGRGAGRAHLIVADEAGARQLFPRDVLTPATLGLPSVVAADPRRLGADLALAAGLRDIVAEAGAFDYVGAARGAESLRAELEARGRDDEAAMRARYVLTVLGSAGIALTTAAEDAADAGEEAAVPRPWSAKSTPYASLLAVLLSPDDRASAYEQHAPAILSALTPPRAAALKQLWGHGDACVEPFVPPLESEADLLFAAPFVRSLDRQAAPGQAPAKGRLALEDWLVTYDRLVELVARRGLAWSHGALLVEERGTVRGLSPEGTASYTKTTALLTAHMEALGKLAMAEPARFQTLGAVNLAYLPGVLGDRALNEVVTRLAQRSVALKISAAEDADQLWEASITAFAIGMGYPPALQGAHFTALRQGLATKLEGGLLHQGGWSVAALAAGNAGLGMLLGDQGALPSAAPQIARALRADAGSYPGVARLVTSAIRYAELAGTSALDAAVSNVTMFAEARRRARQALGEAVESLSEEGPGSPPEKAYAERITDLADAIIVAGLADVAGADADRARCEGDDSVAPSLRDAFDRLQRKRRALLDHAAHQSRDPGTWLSRARLLALVLSDALDILDQKEGVLAFRIPTSEARATVRRALDGWTDAAGVDVATSLYLVGRGAVSEGNASAAMVDDALRALRGLATLFDSGHESGSLFAKLAELGDEADRAEGESLAGLLTGAARGAYAIEAVEHGDLLLMLTLGVALMSSAPVDDAAIDLAKERERPVRLPLLLYGRVARDGADPEPIVQAMKDATAAGCAPPDARAMVDARRAIGSFKRGERRAALESLERILADAEREGLTVPRQVFRYQQLQGDKIFKVEQSISLGEHLLNASGSFEVGLGLQTRSQYGSRFEVEFEPGTSRDAQAEAARYYAHLAAVAAVYAFAAGENETALRHATRAVGAWVNGVRLGADRVPVGGDTVSWARDATPTLAVAAQQAADAGQPMLAGDLWTLAQAALGRGAEDATVDETLDPLPPHLRGIPEVASIVARARDQLETVAAKLDCTTRQGDVAEFQRVGCDRYPTAVGLRIADALPYLPRLRSSAGIGRPGCAPYRALDEFLAAFDEGRYEPDKLNRAVDVAVDAGMHHVAATLLTRQRVPQHCNPDLVRHARVLSKRPGLGVHLRSDLLSVATNCSAPSDLADDLAALDALTQRHADPTRGFEVLVFAARLAADEDTWRPLYSMTQREGFIDRWQALSPELASAALLLHHAAAIALGEPLDREGTLPFYRLLCTTFPSTQRGPICNAVSLLRGSGPDADKKRAARAAVARFVTDTVQRAQQRSP